VFKLEDDYPWRSNGNDDEISNMVGEDKIGNVNSLLNDGGDNNTLNEGLSVTEQKILDEGLSIDLHHPRLLNPQTRWHLDLTVEDDGGLLIEYALFIG